MTQKLTQIIDGSTTSAVYPIRSKLAVRRKAAKKAWKVRKRLAAARAASVVDTSTDVERAA